MWMLPAPALAGLVTRLPVVSLSFLVKGGGVVWGHNVPLPGHHSAGCDGYLFFLLPGHVTPLY